MYEPDLMRFLRRSSRTLDDALDLRQQVYASIYTAAAKERPANSRAYLFACARNALADRGRKAKLFDWQVIEDFEIESVLSDEPSPHGVAESRQLMDRLENALATLPERCRAVIKLRKIDGYSQREVAFRLGISESTVEKHVAAGLRRLADALYDDGSHEGLVE